MARVFFLSAALFETWGASLRLRPWRRCAALCGHPLLSRPLTLDGQSLLVEVAEHTGLRLEAEAAAVSLAAEVATAFLLVLCPLSKTRLKRVCVYDTRQEQFGQLDAAFVSARELFFFRCGGCRARSRPLCLARRTRPCARAPRGSWRSRSRPGCCSSPRRYTSSSQITLIRSNDVQHE